MISFDPIDPNSAAGIAIAKIQAAGDPGLLLSDNTDFVNEILVEAGAAAGDAWCAAFESWAFRQAAAAGAPGDPFHTDASTQDQLAWMNANCPAKVTTNPQDVLAMGGAIFIATDESDDTEGHTGFIINRLTDASGALTAFITCEGNTTNPDGGGQIGAFIKERSVAAMGLPDGWSAVHYVNVEGFAGGKWWG